MGRPQTIFVDRNKLLTNLCAHWKAALAFFDQPLADGERRVEAARKAEEEAAAAFQANHCHETAMRMHDAARVRREELTFLTRQEQSREAVLSEWLPYDLHMLTGRVDLSPSERLRTNQALRSLAAEGLLDIRGTRATAIAPTPAGLARAAELATEGTTDA